MNQFSAEGLINRHIAEMAEADEQDNTRLRASGMGTCKRKRWYYIKGGVAEEDMVQTDSRGQRVFAVGDTFHEWIQGIFREQKVLMEMEGITETNGVGGHFDMLVFPPGFKTQPDWTNQETVDRFLEASNYGEKLILYDIKSQHSKSFHYMTKKGESHEHHHKQIRTYLKGIQENGFKKFDDEGNLLYEFPPLPNLSDIRMLYVSKDDLMILEKGVRASEKDMEAISKEIAEMTDIISSDTPPKPIPEMDWECKYCPFRLICPRGQEVVGAEEQKKAKTMQL